MEFKFVIKWVTFPIVSYMRMLVCSAVTQFLIKYNATYSPDEATLP